MLLRDIHHQDRAVSLLRRALRSGRLPHALLFEGPDGVGKELTARALAARLLCESEQLKPDADACGKCRACLLMQSDTHPDFHLVHRGLHKQHPDKAVQRTRGLFLTVDLVRHFLITPAIGAPMLGRQRVLVVRDAERMNEEAQNALLKTLEEPPSRTTVILLSSSAQRLLATIRSRCQRIPFDFLPADFVREKLGGPAAHAAALAALSQGRLGAALLWQRAKLLDSASDIQAALQSALAGEPEPFARQMVQIATDIAMRIHAKPKDERDESDETEDESDLDDEGETSLKPSKKTVETDQLRDGLRLAILVAGAILRDELVTRSGAADLRQLALKSDNLLARQNADDLAERIGALAETEQMIDRNVAPQLACEWLATALCGDLTPR